jgi:hypothetical protein
LLQRHEERASQGFSLRLTMIVIVLIAVPAANVETLNATQEYLAARASRPSPAMPTCL